MALGPAAMTLLLALVFLALGAAAGAVHFAMIARDAELLIGGGSGSRVAWLRIGRLALSTGVLFLAALSGSVPLIAAMIGLMAARQWATSRFGRIQ